MLSILIPVYCFDLRPLVQQLWQQAQALPHPWEIRLLDDGSPTVWQVKNRALDELTGVVYEECAHNMGRAKIRNKLAASARYEYLLFMDCDSAAPDDQFLARYCAALEPNTVLCGGRTYLPASDAPAHHLHWWYGSQREVRTAAERQQHPYEGFMTNNYVVPKHIAQDIPFEAKLQQYGHEDTLFGLELKRHQIKIQHLDNPLLHIGLEETEAWLKKQQQAIHNLYWLHQQHPDLQTKALKLWKLLHQSGMLSWNFKWIKARSANWEKRLKEETYPPLRLLDALKIVWLEEAFRQKH